MVSKAGGFSVVEVLLAVAVLAVLVTAFTGTIFYGEEGTALAGVRNRAVFLADEGLEATRNIRDASFANLVNGTYGLAISGGQWTFSGTADIDDIFTRQITIADSTISANFKLVTATVTWQQNQQRMGNVTLESEMTNWQSSVSAPSSCTDYCISLGSYSGGTCRKGVSLCNANGEINENGGNSLCQQAEGGTCCCQL